MPETLLEDIKGYLLLALFLSIIILAIVSFIGNWGNHDKYEACKIRWVNQSNPIGIIGYDPEDGAPYYQWPKMSKEFKEKCMNENNN